MVMCPFCPATHKDLEGLKYHLLLQCEGFTRVPFLSERGRSPMEPPRAD